MNDCLVLKHETINGFVTQEKKTISFPFILFFLLALFKTHLKSLFNVYEIKPIISK